MTKAHSLGNGCPRAARNPQISTTVTLRPPLEGKAEVGAALGEDRFFQVPISRISSTSAGPPDLPALPPPLEVFPPWNPGPRVRKFLRRSAVATADWAGNPAPSDAFRHPADQHSGELLQTPALTGSRRETEPGGRRQLAQVRIKTWVQSRRKRLKRQFQDLGPPEPLQASPPLLQPLPQCSAPAPPRACRTCTPVDPSSGAPSLPGAFCRCPGPPPLPFPRLLQSCPSCHRVSASSSAKRLSGPDPLPEGHMTLEDCNSPPLVELTGTERGEGIREQETDPWGRESNSEDFRK